MKIALIGYGKMGRQIEEIALDRQHEVGLRVTAQDLPIDPTALAGCDVAIEFSVPSAASANIHACFKAGIPVVVGTTGWYDHFEAIREACLSGSHTLFHATNFSVGVNLFFALNQHLAALMDGQPDYAVSMEEIHHIHKLDAPSGTAITLAGQILEKLERKNAWVEGASEDPNTLPIHAVREAEVPGTHSITYASEVDEIVISHAAKNRKGFALGAVLAAEWVHGKTGIFTMADLLKF